MVSVTNVFSLIKELFPPRKRKATESSLAESYLYPIKRNRRNMSDDKPSPKPPQTFSIRPSRFYSATPNEPYLDISDDDDDQLNRLRDLILKRPLRRDSAEDDVKFVKEFRVPSSSSWLKNRPTFMKVSAASSRTEQILQKVQSDLKTSTPSRSRFLMNDSFRFEDRIKYEQLLKRSASPRASAPSVFRSPIKVEEFDLTKDDDTPVKEIPKVSRSSTASAQAKDVVVLSDSDNDEVQIVSQKGSISRLVENDPRAQPDYVQKLLDDLYQKRQENEKKIAQTLNERDKYREVNSLNCQKSLEKRIQQYLRLSEYTYVDEDIVETPVLPELTSEHEKIISNALNPHVGGRIVAEKFNLQISKNDINTLRGLNWLNDEIINFYVNLIAERSTLNANLPKTYSMNTFFYPKLVQSGHASLRRWTRKVDIFSYDIIVVPIHLGMHWCMAIIDFRDKSIRYYDSMGSRNDKCLVELRKYLEEESLDKKREKYNTSQWELANLDDIPQQMNGSDCGVFSCQFAEFVTRNAKISFTQEHMEYFRRKMIYEIVSMRLIT